MTWSIKMGMAWRLMQKRILLPGFVYKVWYLGELVYHWWDGPCLRRVPIAPPRDMFLGHELVGEELNGVEKGYLSEDLLEGPHFSYIMTLVPQLIDAILSDFVPPSQANPTQPLTFRAETSRASQSRSASRRASFDLVCSFAFPIFA